MGLSYSDHLYYREEVQLFLRSPDIEITEVVIIIFRWSNKCQF